jgi:hypothetical protein
MKLIGNGRSEPTAFHALTQRRMDGKDEFVIVLRYKLVDRDEAERARNYLSKTHLVQNRSWRWTPAGTPKMFEERTILLRAMGSLTRVSPSAATIAKKEAYLRKSRRYKSAAATRRRNASRTKRTSSSTRSRRTRTTSGK